MTVLLSTEALERRRSTLSPELRALAGSLAADLERVITHGFVIPPEKAKLTRRGGRCEVDGVLLEFDPFSPRIHRCPSCGRVFDDETHYRWWIMGYQLWLAERAVHAAALYALGGEVHHRAFAMAVLDAYADRYLQYPNRDNVLGPTRVFFSTYLESIWLLQLIIALDLLEASAPTPSELRSIGERVRERIVAPSSDVIRGYDEGLSNRQVWNNAALLAASRTLGTRIDRDALNGRSGLRAHLTQGLLSDGTWYEGENYHLFAHRGLWYGVTIAEAAGEKLDAGLRERYDEAFATPFVTALPDYTFPSRRDSQYRVSLRQWRFAELAELGLVRVGADDRLTGALATLYDDTARAGDTGRWRSTAEAERNRPATKLARSDLGWRSLLFASPTLPPLEKPVPRSALMAGQGLAILRRDRGTLYAALDYGHSGAGHGHPDRLNVMLVHGDTRWLDDVGTGSYVDPSLHWYRSTLAHNAPLIDGRSQERVHGTLLAYEDRGAAGWVRASVDGVAPGVRIERTVVAMPNYLLDELTWAADREVTLDLPFHVDGDLKGIVDWSGATPVGGPDAEDGFTYLRATEVARGDHDVRLDARIGDRAATVRVFVEAPHEWWRATSLGAPGEGPRRFHFVRTTGRRGTIGTVWDLAGAVVNASRADAAMVVDLADGSRHEHRGDVDGWHIALTAGGSRSTIDLGGRASVAAEKRASYEPPRVAPHVIRRREELPPAATKHWTGLSFELEEANYRRSEQSWREAGAPTATVGFGAAEDRLIISVNVRKQDVYFAPRCEWNPLDNEHPDTNSDGVQLHVIVPAPDGAQAGATTPREYSWLLVPELGGGEVRVCEKATGDSKRWVRADWHPTSDGYVIHAQLSLQALGIVPGTPFLADVIVNDMSPDRERRRGQLVLGGASNEFVYLRGDRHDRERHLAFTIVDD